MTKLSLDPVPLRESTQWLDTTHEGSKEVVVFALRRSGLREGRTARCTADSKPDLSLCQFLAVWFPPCWTWPDRTTAYAEQNTHVVDLRADADLLLFFHCGYMCLCLT